MSEDKVVFEKCEEKCAEIKKYGWGIRHLQMACMTINMVSLILVRSSMAIAVLAMTDTHQNSTNIEIYNWDKKTQSLILSSFFWGYVAMQIPAGMLARKFGGKPVLTVSLLANGLICLMVPALTSLGGWQLVCVARLSIGITQSCLFPGTQTLLGQWFPASERTNFVGVIYGGTKIGIIFSMALCGILADSVFGWKSIFYAISGILFVNLVIWHFFGANSPRDHRWIKDDEKKYIEVGLNISESKSPPTPWKQILTSRPVLVLLAPQCGYAISYGFFLVDLPTYLEKGLGISLKSSALLAALPYIGMWTGSTISTYSSEKLLNKGLINLTTCRKLFQSISLFGAAAGLVFLSFLGPENKFWAIITLIVSLTLMGCSTAGFIVNQLDLSPNYAGVIMCILNLLSTSISAVFPIITSYILQNDPTNVSRWQMVFLMISGCCVCSGLIFLVFGTSKLQPWDDLNFLDKKLADAEELKPVMSGEKDSKQQKAVDKNGPEM